jgi:hypothetical protein
MNSNTYLKKILSQQTFQANSEELNELQIYRQDIGKLLRSEFSSAKPSIVWAGSKAKNTMILESYDGDIVCYFPRDEDGAGETLRQIYQSVKQVLQGEYFVEEKTSALRIKRKGSENADLHIDIVPGRYIDDTKTDVFLYRNTHSEERLKTNLQTHIDHIRDSGFTDAIRLMKLWKVRNSLDSAKTFVLELLVVKLLEGQQSATLSTQLEHVLTEFRDNYESLTVEDPANSNNNLQSTLDECRSMLSIVAKNTLWQIENNSWESVFGEIEEERQDQADALQFAVASVNTPTRPWFSGFQ